MQNAEIISMIAKDWLLPAFISSVAAFLLGIVWYHPKILGNKWLLARGAQGQSYKNYASSQFIVAFPLWFLTALFFTFMVQYFGIVSPVEIFLLACLLWVAFAMPSIVMGSLYIGHPFEAVAIDASYQLGGYYAIALVHIAYIYFTT